MCLSLFFVKLSHFKAHYPFPLLAFQRKILNDYSERCQEKKSRFSHRDHLKCVWVLLCFAIIIHAAAGMHQYGKGTEK